MPVRKLVVVARFFSGLEPVIRKGEWIHAGSPAYYHFIRLLDINPKFDYQLFLLIPEVGGEETIQCTKLRNLSRTLTVIPYYKLFLSDYVKLIKKLEFFYNKLKQYIAVLKSTRSADCYYVDRDNILFAALILLFKDVKVITRLLGVTASLYQHLTERNNMYSRIIRWVFNHHNSYFVCTNDGSYAEATARIFGQSHFNLLFNGVDKSLMRTVPRRDGRLRIVYLSRIEQDKGYEDFINAIVQSELSDFLDIMIIGDGSLMGEIEALVRKVGLGKRVTFAGRLSHSDAMEQLKEADLFFSINHHGTFGNGVLEAAQMGLPVVTLSHQGCFTEEQYAFEVLANDDKLRENAARAIIRFVQNNSWSDKLAKGSRNFANRCLVSWEERIKNEFDIIIRVCNS